MWDKLHLQNADGGELIFWLILGVLWAVGQVIKRVKGNKGKLPPAKKPAQQTAPHTRQYTQPRTPEVVSEEEDAPLDFDEQMRRFFERIGVEPAEETPPPPPPPPRKPHIPRPRRVPVAVHVEPPHVDVSALGDIYAPITEQGIDHGRVYDDVTDRAQLGTASLVDPRSFLVNLDGLRMPSVRVPVPLMSTTPAKVKRPQLNDRATLRQAIIGQFILAPPLAMGEDKASYTRRAV